LKFYPYLLPKLKIGPGIGRVPAKIMKHVSRNMSETTKPTEMKISLILAENLLFRAKFVGFGGK